MRKEFENVKEITVINRAEILAPGRVNQTKMVFNCVDLPPVEPIYYLTVSGYNYEDNDIKIEIPQSRLNEFISDLTEVLSDAIKEL